MKYKDLKKELFSNPKLRKIRKENQLAYDIANMVLDVRIKKGLTQAQLARRVGTEQPCIARIENGDHLPSMSFLQRVAKALDVDLRAYFFPVNQFTQFVDKDFVFESCNALCSKEIKWGSYSVKFELKNNSLDVENLIFSNLEECYD